MSSVRSSSTAGGSSASSGSSAFSSHWIIFIFFPFAICPRPCSPHCCGLPGFPSFSLPSALASLVNNSRFLRKNLYFEEIARRGRQRQSTEYTWLQQWGLTGELVALNLRLILRNKRTKAVVLMTFVIMLYGFIFYKPVYMKSDHMPMILLGAMFITGIFIMNYGQFLFAWHSGYFDGLMSLPVSVREFIRAQFMMFIAVSTLTFVVTSLYGLISWKIIPFQIAAFLYNRHQYRSRQFILPPEAIKAIDLNRSATFNYQGTGMTQWINILLVLVAPMLIYCGSGLVFNSWVGLTVLGFARVDKPAVAELVDQPAHRPVPGQETYHSRRFPRKIIISKNFNQSQNFYL
jgi:hypothetical protein